MVLKETLKKVNKKPTECEEILKNYVTDKKEEGWQVHGKERRQAGRHRALQCICMKYWILFS